jgi:hypothetical protein
LARYGKQSATIYGNWAVWSKFFAIGTVPGLITGKYASSYLLGRRPFAAKEETAS